VWKLPGTDNILQGWSTQAHYEQSITLIQEFLQKEGADVAVANVINSFFVVEAASRARIPSLWIIHESYDQRTMLRNLNSFSIAACEAAFSKAYRVIFVSRETRELYRRYNRRQNFVVVHNAIRPQETISDQVGPKKAAARQVLDVSPAVKVICSVGTICERKDQETLVKAVARLVKKREDFICYLVGARETDPYLDRVRSLVRKSRLTERIILVPETREVYTYYRAADVFVFTSLNESFSLTILEAMAHGLPIITTPCQGIAEQVRVGKNALMFDFRDASGLAEQLQDLLDDPEKRHRMGENSRAILKYMQTRDEMLYKYRRLIFDAWQVGPVDEAYGRVS
jgi:glycosyltransferase involved in cell wall biosynthesis